MEQKVKTISQNQDPFLTSSVMYKMFSSCVLHIMPFFLFNLVNQGHYPKEHTVL